MIVHIISSNDVYTNLLNYINYSDTNNSETSISRIRIYIAYGHSSKTRLAISAKAQFNSCDFQ